MGPEGGGGAAAPGATDGAARDTPPAPASGLRDLVLGGPAAFGPAALDALRPNEQRSGGRADHPAAEAWRRWLALETPAAALAAWFGRDRLAAIAAAPDPGALADALALDIAALDARIGRQLDAVLHAPRLARLEGSWRGLAWLLDTAGEERNVRLRLLTARAAELARDFDRAIEFDRSTLFRLIYEEEFGTAGGQPFGLVAADLEVGGPNVGDGPAVDEVALLDRLAEVAAAAFCPVALPAAPGLLGLDSFHEAPPAADLAAPLRGPDRARWAALAAREDSRFLALVLPRAPARAPWAPGGPRADGFRYAERAGAPDRRVWMSAVFPLAAVAARAFGRNGWPADIRGAEPGREARGGVVAGLPQERFRADPSAGPSGGPPPRPPLELALSDQQERALADARIIPLCGLEGLPEACFGAVPTLHRPPRLATGPAAGGAGEAANANQALSAQLNTVLCVARFAHLVKLMGRDMVGAFAAPDDVEHRLGRWLSRFVGGMSDSAAYPLRDARVEVRERPGRPGEYGCVMHLQPHHQLDEVGASFRLVTQLAAPGLGPGGSGGGAAAA